MNNSIQTKTNMALGSPWVMSLLAIVELVLGFILLGFPYLLGASAIWVFGIVLLAVGLLRCLQSATHSGNRLWNLLAGILYLVLGWMMVFYTNVSLQVWTLVIGIALLGAGVLRLAVAVAMRHDTGSAWRFFSALVSLVLGGMVVWGWPESSFWLIGTIIAVEMIFSGWTLLFLAIGPRKKLAS